MLWAMERAIRSRWMQFAQETRGETKSKTNIILLAIAVVVVVGLCIFGKEVWDFYWSFPGHVAPKQYGDTPFRPKKPDSKSGPTGTPIGCVSGERVSLAFGTVELPTTRLQMSDG